MEIKCVIKVHTVRLVNFEGVYIFVDFVGH